MVFAHVLNTLFVSGFYKDPYIILCLHRWLLYSVGSFSPDVKSFEIFYGYF